MNAVSNITITHELRPCYANNRKALFHRWIDKEQLIIKFSEYLYKDTIMDIYREYRQSGLLPNSCKTEKITMSFAIVEYEDGTVAEVEPLKIRFADEKIKEYAFT